MSYQIQAGRGLDSARFGERRDELRRRLGEPTLFRRTQSGGLVDHFVEKGLQLSYNAADELEFIELTPEAGVQYDGVELLGRSYGAVLADLRGRGLEGAEDSQGIEFRDLGFALFVPSPEELAEEVQG
ncbi:hypothetical protein ACFTXB_37660, partial [Streptomyces sp. NPDC057074]|uniref:hypothetical protein n=1 Tax=Streptomyces sp. NPDC057074 TaxID=3346015 RepID=UPI003628F99D